MVLVDERPGGRAAAPGGLIAGERRDGFLCERGPQAVLDGPDETRALIAAAGLSDRVQRAAPAARRRFVYVGGALHPFPASPPALVKTSLLSAGGKLRLFAEPFVGRGAADESVLAFVARRFGREAAERAAAPALIGVFAGDAAALSVRSALPRVAAMEREHGSILRALMRRKRGAGLGHPVSFPGGSASCRRRSRRRWAPAGAGRAPAEIAPICRRLARDHRRGRVHRERAAGAGDAGRGDRDAARARTRPRRPRRCARSRTRPWPWSASVFGAAADLGMDLDAYGFVVARGEGVKLLGCQYETSVFPAARPQAACCCARCWAEPSIPAWSTPTTPRSPRRPSAICSASPVWPASPTSSTCGAHGLEFHNTTSRTPTAYGKSTPPSRGCAGSP